MKKLISMFLVLTMVLGMSCITSLAIEGEKLSNVYYGENGYWGFLEKDADTIAPLAVDNPAKTYTIPISPSYCDVTPTKLVLDESEDRIVIEISNFSPKNAILYFNIMNETDQKWVESQWMGGSQMTTSGSVYYTFDAAYLNANRNDKFSVKLRTLNLEATAVIRTYTSMK